MISVMVVATPATASASFLVLDLSFMPDQLIRPRCGTANHYRVPTAAFLPRHGLVEIIIALTFQDRCDRTPL